MEGWSTGDVLEWAKELDMGSKHKETIIQALEEEEVDGAALAVLSDPIKAQVALGLKFGAAAALAGAVDSISGVKKTQADTKAEGLRKRRGAASSEAAPDSQQSKQADDSEDHKKQQQSKNKGFSLWPQRPELPFKYEVMRQVCVVVLFIFLHQLFQWLVFEPVFRPKATDSPLQNVCPPGAEGCSHGVDPSVLRAHGLH